VNDRDEIIREITNLIDQQMVVLASGALSPSEAFEYAERRKQIDHLLEMLKAPTPQCNER
jgi:hypothetical protein